MFNQQVTDVNASASRKRDMDDVFHWVMLGGFAIIVLASIFF
jgi:hypothetical protein